MTDLTITDAFDLPSREQITALGFVVKLEEDGKDARQRLVDDYVLTPKVRADLPVILGELHSIADRDEEVGRFIHGSFGSGKSHFMSLLGMLLEDDPIAWGKEDALVRELADEHRGWIGERGWLVVRIHMLTVSRQGKDFARAVYEGFNRSLERHDKPAFEFLNVDGVLDEARREAERFGDAFWRQLEMEGIVGSREDFEELASGDLEEREDLARGYLDFKGRDPSTAGIDPNWAEGLQRMTAHAKEHGFGGVIFLVDELLLWLSEKTGPEFRHAINQLNTIVDHADGQRAVPLAVFVARQRNLKEFFPDMVQEDELHEHLGHHLHRFEQTTLQDVELRHICRERVLKRKEPEAVEKVLDTLAEKHRKTLPVILQDGDAEYLRDVYPFHPALIEMLIDISSLMQRERTALRLLYELLVLHYPDLPLGELLPVGRAFEAIFPESGVEGSKRVEDLREIHRVYYQRFKPAMAQIADEITATGSEAAEARMDVLDQLVKTALLAEVSPRLKGDGMTVEKLVRLNDVDVAGETDRGRMAKAFTDLVALSQKVPKLQVSGKGRSAVVGIVLRGANFGELLERARAKSDNLHSRFRTFYDVFKDELGLSGKKGFREGERNDGPVTVTWRGTKRVGSVKISNVREVSYEDFKPRDGEVFRLLIDYPWDEPGKTVEDDRDRARAVRRAEGSMATICWLPRHLTGTELNDLRDLAACQFITSAPGQEELLGNLGAHDRQQVMEQATKLAHNVQSKLRDTLGRAYRDAGEAIPLLNDVSKSITEPELRRNLDRFAESLLDRRYPQHPDFGMTPTTGDLGTLLDWMVEAAQTGDRRADFDDRNARILRDLGAPLELVTMGQTRGNLRLDGRYMKEVQAHLRDDAVAWDLVDEKLKKHYGLQPEVRNLFLAFLVRAQGFRALQKMTREPVDVRIQKKAYSGLTLEQAAILDIAEWSRIRELGPSLFDVRPAADHISLAEQDRYAERLRDAGAEARDALINLHKTIQELGPQGTARLDELKAAKDRLRPLVGAEKDSYKVLKALLEAWPDDADDPLRAVVRNVRQYQNALRTLDRNAMAHLKAGGDHPKYGEEVSTHLGWLATILGASDEEQALTENALRHWNVTAHDLLKKLIARPPPPPPPPGPDEPDPDKGNGKAIHVFENHTLDPSDGNALGQFVGDLRQRLQDAGHTKVRIDVTIHLEE